MGTHFFFDRLFRREQLDRSMEEELRFHITQRAAELRGSGVPAGEAERRAQLEFGGMESYKEQCRETRVFHGLHGFFSEGKVIRIDPSVQNGTRTVDVALIGELPPGAVPDLSVDGTIDLERLANVLLVGRPVSGQEKSTVGMFKLQSDGKTASRVQVTLGRSSVNTVEILDGLKDGEQVILSDMSRWDQYNRIRLN